MMNYLCALIKERLVMTVHFQCPKCRKALAVRDEYAGRSGKCTCGAAVMVPKLAVTVVPIRTAAAAEDMIRFACKTCGKRIKVPSSRAGSQGKCPQCKNVISIPTSSDRSTVEQVSEPVVKPQAVAAGDIRVPCAMCNTVVHVPESSAGNLVECKKCGSFVEVPLPKGAVVAGGQSDAAAASEIKRAAPSTGRTVCPSCSKKLADDASVCVGCGIYVRSGRPILMTRGVDEDDLYDRAHTIISPLSWIIWYGIYPVYSEVLGKCRPWAIWAITAVTILISAWFLSYQYSDSPKMRSMKNLMLWAGKGEPDPEQIELMYEYTSYGDVEAFDSKKEALKATVQEDDLTLAALEALGPEDQCIGEFRASQLITYAFLHGGPLHLAGNLLFLLIFGSRVCSVIGNVLTPFLYLILAFGAGFTHLVMMGMQPPGAMLGASGAVMGMAGVYLVLFPIQKIYMAAWWRWGLLLGFRLSFNTFAVRGFWVVLFYICFDIVAVALSAETGTAHWAHIGGLLWGIGAGLVLLMSRATYSGSDILSLTFGKYAWRLIGTPVNRI
jgi:membrane associated rhomboid family serine protease